MFSVSQLCDSYHGARPSHDDLRRRRIRQPRLEPLEGRIAPAVLIVNSTGDGMHHAGDDLTLRQPVAVVDSNSKAGLSAGEPQQVRCKLGDDMIELRLGQVRTITLRGAGLTINNPAGTTTILGPRAHAVSIRGAVNGRLITIATGSTVDLENTDYSNDQSGGAVLNDGTLTMINCGLSENTAATGGGLLNNGTATLTRCTISADSATTNGGGLFNNGTATLIHCALTGNAASLNGGSLDNAGQLTLSGCTFTTSTAINSGGIYNVGAVTSSGCTFSADTAQAGGGALINFGGDVTLSHSTVTGNVANRASGAGLCNFGGTASLTDCTLNSNQTRSGAGGGVSNGSAATLAMAGCTVNGNGAGLGSGIANTGTAVLTNCTINSNSFGGSTGNGGGLFNAATLWLYDCTVSNNKAANGGGLGDNGGSATLVNTIIAGNTAATGPDIAGAVTANYCLFATTTGAAISGGHNIIGNPMLGPLANNGGPTQTQALITGSPAITAGNIALIPTGVTTDQRGAPFDRIFGINVDIGACEAQSLHLVVNSTADPVAGNTTPGQLTLRAAIQLANVNPVLSPITFNLGGGRHTIKLSSTLELSNTVDGLSIDGPGAGLLTISGGGTNRVFLVSTGATAALSGLAIEHGQSSQGGAILDRNGTRSLTNCSVSHNKAPSAEGGGIASDGTLSLTNCTVGPNQALQGGGIFNRGGPLSLTDCNVSDNTATGALDKAVGGGIASDGALSLTNCTVSHNQARAAGGGIEARTATSLTNCTISHNKTSNNGGGIANIGGGLSLFRCTVSRNWSPLRGGGLYNSAGASATLISSTLSSNNGSSAGGGADNNGKLTMRNCTVTDNDAYSGAGIFTPSHVWPNDRFEAFYCTIAANRGQLLGGGISILSYIPDHTSVYLTNTIVANNWASEGSEINANSRVSASHCLFSSTAGTRGLDGGQNLVVHPKLGPLASNGGSTQTMALLPGSPAIGKGIAIATTTTDQRGFARPASNPDIGAFQTQTIISTAAI
jgi:hypothetical protein